MTEQEKLNLAEGKERAAEVFQETMKEAKGFFLVLGADFGERARVIASFGGLMGKELPRHVVTKVVKVTLALEGKIPFSDVAKEGEEDAGTQ